MEEKNAKVTDTFIGCEDHGLMTLRNRSGFVGEGQGLIMPHSA